MSFNLHNRHFLKEIDFTPQEMRFLLSLAGDLKTGQVLGLPRAVGSRGVRSR